MRWDSLKGICWSGIALAFVSSACADWQQGGYVGWTTSDVAPQTSDSGLLYGLTAGYVGDWYGMNLLIGQTPDDSPKVRQAVARVGYKALYLEAGRILVPVNLLGPSVLTPTFEPPNAFSGSAIVGQYLEALTQSVAGVRADVRLGDWTFTTAAYEVSDQALLLAQTFSDEALPLDALPPELQAGLRGFLADLFGVQTREVVTTIRQDETERIAGLVRLEWDTGRTRVVGTALRVPTLSGFDLFGLAGVEYYWRRFSVAGQFIGQTETFGGGVQWAWYSPLGLTLTAAYAELFGPLAGQDFGVGVEVRPLRNVAVTFSLRKLQGDAAPGEERFSFDRVQPELSIVWTW